MESSIRFEWDDKKNEINKAKHDVSFDEAKSVFYDPSARVIPDDIHSANEDRFIILGMGRILRVLVVCYCYRAENEVIRIISARKANSSEKKQYETLRR